MQFFSPEAFLFLWAVPGLLFLFWISQQLWRKRLAQFAEFETVRNKLMPAYDPKERTLRLGHLILIFLFAALALARPQWGEAKKKIERKGVDLIILLDTSLSMLAEDVKPSRFQKSKLELKTLVRNLKGDRVGMIAFAGSGFLQAPLTLDYSTFLLFLDAVEVGYIPDPGTSLAQALRLAARSFPTNNLKYKALILFTDGEDHIGGVEQALAEIKKQGIRIYSIGVGTLEGQPIPLRDEQGRKSGFKKDRSGEIVITKLNPPLLEKIALETGGLYLPSTPSEEEISVVLKHREGLGKKQFKERMVDEKEEHFQIFLFMAVCFLILEMLCRRMKPQASVRNHAQAASVLILFFLFSGFLESPKGLTDKGNKLYREKKYQSALKLYQTAKVKNPESPAIRYDLGTTQYQLNQYQEAGKELEKAAADSAAHPELQAKALYNYGNTQYRLGNFQKAIEAYQKTLELNPKDVDAKYNLEFLLKEKSIFEKKNQERKKQQNPQQNQQQQQQQQQPDQSQKPQNQEGHEGQDKSKDQQKQDQKNEKEQDQNPQPQSQSKEDKENQEKQEEKDQQQPQQPQQAPEKDKSDQQQQPGAEPQPMPTAGDLKDKKPEGKTPLQGQMSLENAIQLLDALKDSEKELQDLRRPQLQSNQPQVEKDW